MNENTFLIFTGIHPSLSLFQENIETEVMDSWWRLMKRLFSFLLLVQHFTITLLNDQDYSPDGRLIVNVISERVLRTRRSFSWPHCGRACSITSRLMPTLVQQGQEKVDGILKCGPSLLSLSMGPQKMPSTFPSQLPFSSLLKRHIVLQDASSKKKKGKVVKEI